MSFRGVRQLTDDEESRSALKILRARFFAPLRMTSEGLGMTLQRRFSPRLFSPARLAALKGGSTYPVRRLWRCLRRLHGINNGGSTPRGAVGAGFGASKGTTGIDAIEIYEVDLGSAGHVGGRVVNH